MGYPQHIHEHYWSIHLSRVLGWKISGSFGINGCIFSSISDVAFAVCLGINNPTNLPCFWPKIPLFSQKNMFTDKLVEINEKGHIIVSSWLSSSVLSETIQAGLKRKKVFNGQNWIIIILMYWNFGIIFSLVWTGDRFVLFHAWKYMQLGIPKRFTTIA